LRLAICEFGTGAGVTVPEFANSFNPGFVKLLALCASELASQHGVMRAVDDQSSR
jgi:hypothetical protein